MVRADNFAVAVSEILGSYRAEIRAGVAQAVEKAGKTALKIVRDKSPVKTGAYKKSWKKKAQRGGVAKGTVSVTVYNDQYGHRVHLLENGHQKVNGGRVEGIPHVAPAVEAAERVLEDAIAQTIEEAANEI